MKKLICLLLALACCLSLFGCHGKREKMEFVMPMEFDTSKDYEISFWAKNDTNMTQVNIYKQAIADFEALYPNIKVNLRLYTDYGKIYNDVITNIATDTTPNVCITYPDHIATYLTGSDTVVPLDELFADPNYGFGGSKLRFDGPDRDEMIQKFLDECAFNGHYYAIPYMRSTEACYVNKTYVEKLGYELPEVLTWDFVWEVSEAATKKDANGNYLVNGQKTMLPFMYKSTDNMMIQMLRQKGAGYSKETGEVLIFNDTTTSLLYEIGEHSGNGAFATFKTTGYPANYLNAGQCIFAVDSTAGATWMGSDAPLIDIAEEKLVQFETVVYPVPQFDPEDPVMISQGPSICIFNKADSQEVLASWLFAQFMLTNSVQIAYSQTEGYCPVTSKAQNDPLYQDYLSRAGENNELYYDIKIQATKLLLENTDRSFVTPVFNGSASLRDAAGHMIEQVRKSARRKETLDEAYMKKLFADTASLYRLDQIRVIDPGDPQDASAQKLLPLDDRLPAGSVVLLVSLCGIWLCMGIYGVKQAVKRKKEKNQ